MKKLFLEDVIEKYYLGGLVAYRHMFEHLEKYSHGHDAEISVILDDFI